MQQQQMTSIDDIRHCGKEFITPKELSGVLHCKPYTLNVTAREGNLKIPHTFVGRNLLFPVNGVISWYDGQTN